MFEESATQDIAAEAARDKGVSRRQLVKAGAWAAPVVVLAAATPAASASVTGVTGTTVATSGSGGKTVALTVTVNATQPPTGLISITAPSPHTGSWVNGGTNPQAAAVVSLGGGAYSLTFPQYTKSSNNAYPYSVYFNGSATAGATGTI